jgi:hypothetical protein
MAIRLNQQDPFPVGFIIVLTFIWKVDIQCDKTINPLGYHKPDHRNELLTLL